MNHIFVYHNFSLKQICLIVGLAAVAHSGFTTVLYPSIIFYIPAPYSLYSVALASIHWNQRDDAHVHKVQLHEDMVC